MGAMPQYGFAGLVLCLGCGLIFKSNLQTSDPVISRTHLKIYSVVYDTDEKTDIKPMVYAENLSSNGIYWNDNYFGKGQGGVLLSHNDELRLSPRLTLTFSSKSDAQHHDLKSCYRQDFLVGLQLKPLSAPCSLFRTFQTLISSSSAKWRYSRHRQTMLMSLLKLD